MADAREVWITGIGLASSLGDGLEAHWEALSAGRVNVDEQTYAPWLVHPLAPIAFDQQIPKKGDQRQMELWQRIGTYAAGLALDSAGIKGNADILGRTDMIVAAGGGERDQTVDGAIITDALVRNAEGAAINERLMNDLRPTLFLAQLSNLLAGNISIVHGVTGSSRTFMGEESSGIDALRIATSRIQAGQSDIALVGAAYNAERKDMLLLYEFGGFNLKDRYAPLWSRDNASGFVLGSAGVFLVLESRAHAEARGAKPFARLTSVVADHVKRANGALTATLENLWQRVGSKADAIITTVSGAEPASGDERRFLAAHAEIPVRATATAFGQTLEAQMPLAVALAALSVSRGALFPPNDPTGTERPAQAAPARIVAVTTGHWRGEGMALIEKADGEQN